MFTSVPVNVIVASAVPSPTVKVRPVRPESVRVPLVAVSVTRRMPVPSSASTSPIEISFPLAAEKTSVVSSSVVCAPGTTLIGASFVLSTVMLTTSVSESAPPSPALPRSFVVIVSVAGPL
jgi:hypothetical protein